MGVMPPTGVGGGGVRDIRVYGAIQGGIWEISIFTDTMGSMAVWLALRVDGATVFAVCFTSRTAMTMLPCHLFFPGLRRQWTLPTREKEKRLQGMCFVVLCLQCVLHHALQ